MENRRQEAAPGGQLRGAQPGRGGGAASERGAGGGEGRPAASTAAELSASASMRKPAARGTRHQTTTATPNLHLSASCCAARCQAGGPWPCMYRSADCALGPHATWRTWAVIVVVITIAHGSRHAAGGGAGGRTALLLPLLCTRKPQQTMVKRMFMGCVVAADAPGCTPITA